MKSFILKLLGFFPAIIAWFRTPSGKATLDAVKLIIPLVVKAEKLTVREAQTVVEANSVVAPDNNSIRSQGKFLIVKDEVDQMFNNLSESEKRAAIELAVNAVKSEKK